MTLTHRRILYSLFFLIFFITAPIVVLWAEGYKYNFTKNRFEKTGVLFLESKPSKAEIYLNNELQDDKTTARLKNLLPDDYQVEIKKQGYQSWQKKLRVYPGQTTFAQYIRLFKQDPNPETILLQKIIINSQPTGNVFAFIAEQGQVYKLFLFNLENQALTEVMDLGFKPDEIVLSPQKTFIILKNKGRVFYINLNTKNLVDLSKITKKEITHLRWSEADRDEIVYAVSQSGLEKMNLISQKSLILLKKPILDFYLIKNSIFFLERTKENILLNKTNFNNIQVVETLTSLPISDSYKFYDSPPSYLILLDEKNKILYLINIDLGLEQEASPRFIKREEKIKIFPETSFVKWFKGGKVFLFGNNFEISIYDLEKMQENLILRLSSEIKKVIWYPVPTHLIYLLADSIKVIETVGQQRNLCTLINKPNIKDIFVNNKGNKLYFIDDAGLHQVEIQ